MAGLLINSGVSVRKGEIDKINELEKSGVHVTFSGNGELSIDNVAVRSNGSHVKVHIGNGSYEMSLPREYKGRGRLDLEVYFHGKSGSLVIGVQNYQGNRFVVRFWGSNNKVFIGDDTTSNGTEIVVQGENKKIKIGDDCMFARGVWIRNSDMHAIFDITTKERINPEQSVDIHNHVWLGQDSFVRSCRIGRGAIIGARSMCTKDVEKYTLCVGTPAKKIKENVSWDRGLEVTEETVDRLGL